MKELKEYKKLEKLFTKTFDRLIVITFFSGKHNYTVNYKSHLEKLVEYIKFPENEVIFVSCDVQNIIEVVEEFSLNVVPCIIFTNQNKQILYKFENIQPAIVIEKIEKAIQEFKISFEKTKQKMFNKISQLIQENPLLVFLTGTASNPYCRFSVQMVEELKNLEVNYAYYNINIDIEMRSWIRQFNGWPTFPQFYICGELQGGLDKTRELLQQGIIQKKLPKEAKLSNPKLRFTKILQENEVVLFLDESSQDSRNKTTVQTLIECGVQFNCFNIQQDSFLQKYLQESFNYQLPLFFCKKQIIGSFEQIQQLKNKDQLLKLIPNTLWRLNSQQKIIQLVKQCQFIVFINGTEANPSTQQSQELISIIKSFNIKYDYFNVDIEENIQQELQSLYKFSKLPLLFINGHLIGDLDVVKKLNNDGDLYELIKKQIY